MLSISVKLVLIHLSQWLMRRYRLKIFLFLALLAIFQQSETTLAIFEMGNMRIICVELFRFWTSGSRDVALRYFLFSSVSHFV